ncbi:MAG: hypothetical protein A2583_15375 [Bdellovibrionales bacterium RIFOXYD1_FULL_53_11]|nr:MAG: hypothetical protein A2583_15375 [Bdellovibrionales bacterium RIFOXYD1_FULL_53_11]
MTSRLRGAQILTALLGIAGLLAISGADAYANGGLGSGVRIQQEFYKPLVPVTRNFKTCFSTDSSGAQVMGICTSDSPAQETAASQNMENSTSSTQPAGRTPATKQGASNATNNGNAGNSGNTQSNTQNNTQGNTQNNQGSSNNSAAKQNRENRQSPRPSPSPLTPKTKKPPASKYPYMIDRQKQNK